MCGPWGAVGHIPRGLGGREPLAHPLASWVTEGWLHVTVPAGTSYPAMETQNSPPAQRNNGPQWC